MARLEKWIQPGRAIVRQMARSCTFALLLAGPAGAQTAAPLVPMLAAHIRAHLAFAMPDGPVQNFPVEYAFVLKPDGDIDALRLVRPSGLRGFDEAVKAAIAKSQPFPVAPYHLALTPLVLASYPLEGAAANLDNAEPARTAYQAAMTLFRAGKYAESITAFTDVTTAFPGSAFMPYARYWRGTAYFALRRYPEALAEQQGVLAAFPASPIIPEVLTNMAATYRILKDSNNAQLTDAQIVRDHPQSAAAVAAARRLQ